MSSCLARKSFYGLLVSVLLLTPAVLAAPTPEQRREVNALMTQILKAGRLYTQGMYKESGEVVRDVQERSEKLIEGADEDLVKLVQPVYNRIVRAHALLELEGIELPTLKKLEEATRPGPTPAAEGGAVSFTKQVALFLVAKCGRCHVNGSRGEFNMATYPALMRGSSAGVVIFPGDGNGSRLVEVIEEGDMPRGGGQVSSDELAMLKQWIQQGAKFDGDDENANLNTFASGAAPENQPAVSVTRPTGNESVSFSRDIAAVLGANCNGCHVDAQRARGNLNMSSFAGLVRGGDSGPPVLPRDPARSILLQRIKGEGGEQRMPVGRPPLPDDVIAMFEKWIAEGATFDGPDPNQNVIQLAALAKARSSTHEQLSAERAQLAEDNWRLGMGRMPFARFETENFLLLGNVGEATLEDHGKRAEALAPKVAAMLGAPTDRPLLKGRMTLFLFNQRYDYSEFGQMVERREIPKEWRGHWQFSVVDAYGAMLPPREDDEFSLEGLIAQQLTGAYVASLGAPPRWFSEGVARVVADRLAPGKDPRIVAWDTALSGVLGSMSQPDDFLRGRLPAEDADIASYSFAKFLMKDSRRFSALLTALRGGQGFDRSFAGIYGANPSKAAEIWIRSAARR